MSWQDYHLYMFTIAGKIYDDPEDDEYGDLGTKNEKRYRLNQLGLREKAKFSYEYDFGDSWEQTLLVEKILPAETGVHHPRGGYFSHPPDFKERMTEVATTGYLMQMINWFAPPPKGFSALRAITRVTDDHCLGPVQETVQIATPIKPAGICLSRL
jgi:hypothetical protein